MQSLAFRANSNPRFGRKATVIALGAGLIAFATFLISVTGLLHQQQAAIGWVDHTLEVLKAATTLNTDLAVALSESHDFTTSRNANSIAQFDAVSAQAAKDIVDLRVLTADNSVQQSALSRVASLIAARTRLLHEFNEGPPLSDADRASRIVTMSQADTTLKAQLFTEAEGLNAEERHLLGERQNAASNATRLLVSFLVGCGVLTAASGFYMTSQLRDRRRERELRAANEAVREITTRNDTEKQLAQKDARYRGLLEAAPDAMVVVNRDREIVLLNTRAEEQFGYSRDELLGEKVEIIIPEGFKEWLIADDLRSATEAPVQQIRVGVELYGRRKDGSDFPTEIMLSPLDTADGVLVTAAIRDITTRKRAEAHTRELSRSNEELEQFAYIASHDLQEPLRMVTSYTQLLSRRYKGKLDADADEFIAFAVDGATRMQRLIQDLLAYSHVGTTGIDLLDISSEHALHQALANLRDAIERSGAQVTHDPLPVVQADEMQLIQLFQNLAGNAVKYQAHEAPLVHVSAVRVGGGRWMFSVKDNGLGIEPKYFEKIFGMFQRLHRRDEFAGTGIGLAICKRIVERHGGSISVELEPGQGSTFRFALAGSEA